jgi:JmjC domain
VLLLAREHVGDDIRNGHALNRGHRGAPLSIVVEPTVCASVPGTLSPLHRDMLAVVSAAPSVTDERLLQLDRESFARAFARDPCAVHHSLVLDPLLSLDAIAELADAMPLKRVERHRADLPMVMPGGAPELQGPPSETVRTIETNNCWLVLWYIEQVPEYAELLDSCLDVVEPYVKDREGGMCRREAFLFLSAPDAVTPVHFDAEHNFLLQIKGVKDMNVCKFPDAAVAQKELDRYYDGGHRNLEAMPSESTLFRLHPGDGVYVPSFMPHWVKNGNEASISLSITFRTEVSERNERVQYVNARLRRLRFSPQPPGQSERADRLKEIGFVTLLGWRDHVGRLKRVARRVWSRARR